MGGYYFWSICYCLPISLFINAGVNHDLINYLAITFSGILIIPGVYLHAFKKIEYLKAYKENNYSKGGIEFIV